MSATAQPLFASPNTPLPDRIVTDALERKLTVREMDVVVQLAGLA